MDLNILLAALGLLVASLAEIRSVLKDKSKDQIKPIGVVLIQLVFTLDRIIEAGDKIISILANVPLNDERVLGTLSKTKVELLSLIKEQRKNLETFNEFYNTTIDQLNPKNTLSIGSAIEFMFSKKPAYFDEKGIFIDRAEGELLNTKPHSNYLALIAKTVLQIFDEAIKIDEGTGDFGLHFPTKIQFGVAKLGSKDEHVITLKGKDIISYDLTKRVDIRRLLEIAHQQLGEIKIYRQQLAQFIQSSFSLDDLMKH